LDKHTIPKNSENSMGEVLTPYPSQALYFSFDINYFMRDVIWDK